MVREVTDHDFDGDEKTGLMFEDETTLVLNKTNAGFLAKLGYSWESLPGATITLGGAIVKYQGQDVAAVRIVAADQAGE